MSNALFGDLCGYKVRKNTYIYIYMAIYMDEFAVSSVQHTILKANNLFLANTNVAIQSSPPPQRSEITRFPDMEIVFCTQT